MSISVFITLCNLEKKVILRTATYILALQRLTEKAKHCINNSGEN